jgi:hypothetical protein
MVTTNASRRPIAASQYKKDGCPDIRPVNPHRTSGGAHHAPVFVDRTGRRRRVLTAAGIGGVAVVVSVLVGLLLAMTGAGSHGLPGLPPGQARAAASHASARTTLSTRPSAEPATGVTSTGTTPTGAAQPGPTPAPATTAPGTVSPSPSPSSKSHRHVPTQTPSHKK